MFGVVYSASETVLNAITLAFAIELESTNLEGSAACPGFTATDRNNFADTQTVEQAAREPVRLALLGANGLYLCPTGPLRAESSRARRPPLPSSTDR
jgi:NAD(P)-dependent dehydrogenase (short-subunit alcohol dehydrogenase family)